MQRPPVGAFDPSIIQSVADRLQSALPEIWMLLGIAPNYLRGDQRVPVESPGERRDAHPIINSKLKWFHSIALTWVVPLPIRRVRVIGQPAHARQSVINVAGFIFVAQHLVLEPGGGDGDLLRSPIEIEADRVRVEFH